jgi:diguanylate cyclase (GGDEF)-like protein
MALMEPLERRPVELAAADVYADVTPDPMERQLELFWRSYLLLGFGTLATACASVAAYALATPDGANRRLIEILAVVAGVSGFVGVGLSERVAGRSWRARFALGWVLGSSALAAFGAYLDGGMSSPIAYLLAVPVVLASLRLSATAVAACTASTVLEIAIVYASRPTGSPAPGNAVLLAEMIIGMGVLGTISSSHRSRMEAEGARFLVRLRRLSRTDGLTECLNRRAFDEQMRIETERALRHRRPLSLLLADVDSLKAFNDSEGHAAGDSALQAVGQLIRDACRATDIVGRVGGDEFAVLLPDTPLEETSRLVDYLNSSRTAGDGPGVTVSAGAAELDFVTQSCTEMFNLADLALYETKAARARRSGMPTTTTTRRLTPSRGTSTRPTARAASNGRRSTTGSTTWSAAA